ncbi:complexed with cef1p, partial [Coemansia asiatica]
MTTAARPTFNPAKGKANDELSYMVSAKDLPGHTRLKTRKPGQGKQGEYSVEELKRELKEAERKHFETKQLSYKPGTEAAQTDDDDTEDLAANRARYIEMAQMLDAASSEEESSSEDDVEDGDSSSGSGSEDESGDEEEDETALLMRELEKIKRERAEEKARQEREAEESRLLNADS